MMDSDNDIFVDESKTVCIIGSGLSGLTCGMKLAKAGFNVTVVEELLPAVCSHIQESEENIWNSSPTT